MSDKDPVARPVFRNVSDVLSYASKMLRHMANEQKMLAVISEVIEGREDLFKKAPEGVKAALLEPAKQQEALSKTADLLFDLAVEHKVLEMGETKRGS